jgi:Rieske Fe-S protein
MNLLITMTAESTRYAVKDGQIYFVKLSKPAAISDTDDYFAKPDITPYLEHRTLSYGVLMPQPDGYSYRDHNIKKFRMSDSNHAKERYTAWCDHFGCTLSWNEARQLAGWC